MPNITMSPEQATVHAANAATAYAAVTSTDRSRFLSRIAECLEGRGEALIEAANRETALPLPRLQWELGRTCNQLRMFASLIQTADWLDVRIETADPGRQPIPKPDLRRTQVPLGPVVVFGASNFPLAFSVAGGDTASALAAGCPVIAKAHPAHPETSRIAGEAILDAIADCEMPEGTFALVSGGPEVGRQLVLDPKVYAVGFTGSHRVGRELFNLAAGRPRPISVYAEMGSVNPMFVLPGAVPARGEALAKGYADSLTLGVGQFCTNPGVVVGLAGDAFDSFLSQVAGHLEAVTPGTMLTPEILAGYSSGVSERSSDARLTKHHCGDESAPALFSVDAPTFLADAALREELFGPAAIAVRCASEAEMIEVAVALEGQLTATVHFEAGDLPLVRDLLPALTRMAGRVVANGYPTGVEVNSAMHHGGPYPATTDSRSTSVGTAAILRFVRPVAYQGFPSELLPPELR